jgi:hypothetical protein
MVMAARDQRYGKTSRGKAIHAHVWRKRLAPKRIVRVRRTGDGRSCGDKNGSYQRAGISLALHNIINAAAAAA